ncbi:hypothetical protein [Mycobacterium sp. 852014-50255_SCH5639931]|uniref:hypothetical protein n=1 Tax=Mycobacterium sp. 852014-50255_SCH5639931 TaxID=1834112 RepID=UPI000B26D623|nr:hypothetical protein [Mycobacterium sp. 852014-50255_SCH5639931]
MNITLTRIAAGAVLSSGLATAGFALAAGTAHAQPSPAPQAYWCPNQPWNPAWGENKYWNQCWDTDNPPNYPPPPPSREPNFNCGLFWCPVPPHP